MWIINNIVFIILIFFYIIFHLQMTSHGIIITKIFPLNFNLDFELTEAVCKLRHTKVWQNHCDNQRLISLYSLYDICEKHQNVAHNLIQSNLNVHSPQLQTGTFLVSYSFMSISLTSGKDSSSSHYRLAVGASVTLRPFPAMGRSLSSHSVTPSQAQICLGFWNKPAERAMTAQASLREERERQRALNKHTRSTEGHQTAGRELWTDWDFCKSAEWS